MLIKSPSQSLTRQLVERFAARICDRLLAPGARLPSIRECARQRGVSPHTVAAAYDQLPAQGLIQSRKNRGFFVRETSSRVVAESVNASFRPSHATALIRAMFHGISAMPQPGMGVLPPNWLAAEFLNTALRKVIRSPGVESYSLQYGEPAGDLGLRNALALRLSDLNVHCAAQQIITTVGATQALDMVSRTMLRAGDPVMVEEPGWTVEFARLEALGMRILPVPRGPDGPDIDVMAHYCEAHAPKLFVSVSVLHNPTGYSLSPRSAHCVLQLANQHDFHVVEDDT